MDAIILQYSFTISPVTIEEVKLAANNLLVALFQIVISNG